MKLAKADLGSLLYVCRNLREADRAEIFASRWTDDPDELAIEAATRWGDFSYIAFGGDGVPIASVGASPLHPGVWSGWMMATDDFHTIGKQLTRWMRKVMIPAVVEAGCHRAEARSAAEHHEAHAWMRMLGAKREAVLRQFGREKQDFHLFVWEF
jgi:RimJ/RimL family protein N-acetyltransferase